MKTYKIILNTLFLFVLTLSAIANDDIEKKYHESYTVDNKTNLNISNVYGNVTIRNTTQDEMTIDVVVTVGSRNNKRLRDKDKLKLQTILDEISIKIERSGNVVIAETQVQTNKTWDIASVDVNYVICMPSYVNTKLNLRFGDANIDKISGKFDCKMRYGNFRANELLPSDENYSNSLHIAHCRDVKVWTFKKIDLDISYSKAKLGIGNAVNLKSKYSDVEIRELASVKANLAHGGLSLHSASDVSIYGRYSDMDFDIINGSLVVDSKYGDVDVDLLSPDFKLMKIDANYCAVNVAVSIDAEYIYDFSMSHGHLSLPKIFMKNTTAEGNNEFARGFVGNENSGNRIEIDSSYGGITLSTE